MTTATLTEPAPPRALLRAIARARSLALRHLEAPTGASWRAIAETQTAFASECLEALAALVEALDPMPTR